MSGKYCAVKGLAIYFLIVGNFYYPCAGSFHLLKRQWESSQFHKSSGRNQTFMLNTGCLFVSSLKEGGRQTDLVHFTFLKDPGKQAKYSTWGKQMG